VEGFPQGPTNDLYKNLCCEAFNIKPEQVTLEMRHAAKMSVFHLVYGSAKAEYSSYVEAVRTMVPPFLAHKEE
jgi:DNA polymerase I-like protein with 3'-5' exonuclease and polymerase domains